MVRTTVTGYASTISLKRTRKVVIIDEADYLTTEAQAAFRNLIEEFSDNCSFIFTCNYKEKIIEPIHSRCAVIDFRLNKEEKTKMASLFFKRIQQILEIEKVDANEKVVAEVIKKHFPDFRRVLNELQRFSKYGKIDVGVLTQLKEEDVENVIEFLKNKDFASMKRWLANSDYESTTLYRKLFDSLYEKVEARYIPSLVITLADYQYKHAFVADSQLNDLAMLTMIMMEAEFK
jgi:DNA polymerase III delta prime subunit